ncbi:hypothetical protein ACGF4C_20330 [Streptomyces sp. NPDC048197]|uniref:hypothetical protein n=1 Tax=Streptomyces sp. NPDC048197 TaxID=3365511 RepID=UPI0037123DB9
MTEAQSSGPVFHQNVYAGGTGAQGMEVTQNVGIRAADLPLLVARLRELAPSAGAEGRDEYIADVEILEDETQAPVGRVSAWQRLRSALTTAGTNAAAAGVVALGDQMISAVTG